MGDIISGIAGIASNGQPKQFSFGKHSALGETYLPQGGNAINAIMDLLLHPDSPAGKTAFNNYRNSTGYLSQMKAGSDAVTGSMAARGDLNSGATARALTTFGQNLGSNYFSNFVGELGKVAGLGVEAGKAIVGAGNPNSSNASNVGGGIASILNGASSIPGLEFLGL